MNTGKIVVVEDEEAIRIGLKDSLELEGYEVYTAEDGEIAYNLIMEKKPDLIILDLMLPKLSGYDVCKKIRNKGIDSFIIMLTAKREEVDKIIGFNAGTDDYMVKPFSIMELLAKIKAIFKRFKNSNKNHDVLEIDNIKIDFKKYEAIKNSQPLEFSSKEFSILKYFADHNGEVVSRDALLDSVWGYEIYPSTRTVDNFIVRLRQKLEKDPEKPKLIKSIRGVGYKFDTNEY